MIYNLRYVLQNVHSTLQNVPYNLRSVFLFFFQKQVTLHVIYTVHF